jgi:hypothetical protein
VRTGRFSASRSNCSHKENTRPANICLEPHPILLLAMGLCISTTSRPQSRRIGQGAISGESQWQRYASLSCYVYWLVSKHGPMGNSPHIAPIHVLDDDSLLHVFYLYRPFLLGEGEDGDTRLFGGEGRWVRGRWWYKLAHVCQRWRNLILGSASYLGVSLVCTLLKPSRK